MPGNTDGVASVGLRDTSHRVASVGGRTARRLSGPAVSQASGSTAGVPMRARPNLCARRASGEGGPVNEVAARATATGPREMGRMP